MHRFKLSRLRRGRQKPNSNFKAKHKPAPSSSQSSYRSVKVSKTHTKAPETKKRKKPRLSIGPSSNIVFRRKNVDGKTGRYVSSLVLRNTNKSEQLGFKIKTNSPDHYHISPSTGFICANSSVTVIISLLRGFEHSTSDDKFLIMYQRKLPPSSKNQNAKEFWQCHSEKNQHHKRRVRVKFLHDHDTDQECVETDIEEIEEEFGCPLMDSCMPKPSCNIDRQVCRIRCPQRNCNAIIKKTCTPQECRMQVEDSRMRVQDTPCRLLDDEFQRLRDCHYQKMCERDEIERLRENEYEDLTCEVNCLRDTLENVECNAEELRNNLRWSMGVHAFVFFLIAYFIIQYYALLARSNPCDNFYR